MAGPADIKLRIEGMHCAGCVSNIEKNLSTLEGVSEGRVNLAMRSAVVDYDPKLISPEEIIGKIQSLGYQASVSGPDVFDTNLKEVNQARENFLKSLAFSIPLMVIAMWPMMHGKVLVTPLYDGIIQAVLAGLVLFMAGRSILRDAWLQTTHLRANMNSLVAMGTLTAYGWSIYVLYRLALGGESHLYFDSAGMIITLILLGRYLEARARGKAGDAIRALLDLRPARTTAVINDVEVEVDTESVSPDMVLIVRPGERIPADGEIVEGEPVIDESMLTGESLPIEKKVGQTVIGGSLNGNTPFRMRVTASGDESYLATVVRLVSEAQSNKAPVQQLADRVAAIFVPIVLVIALITLVIWYLLAPDSPLLIKSVVSVLIVACPCALGLATPTAVLAGTGRAAREGIIIRGGDVLEAISGIDTVVFDKTGTLTHGELDVVAVKTTGSLTEERLLQLAGGIENLSEHPIGAAVVRYVRQQQIKSADVVDASALPGSGMKARYEGKELLVGNAALMVEREVDTGSSSDVAEQEMKEGRTVVFVALDGQVIGLVSLADRIRGEARDLIVSLKQGMNRVMLISGDSRLTVEGVARTLELDYFESEVKPEQKQAMIDSLRRIGFRVAMVGDGINDAPALAEADVGIAIGSGTDVALEAADVVLVRSDVSDLRKMFDISRHSLKTIKQNLFWAFFYNVVAIPIAAGVLYPVAGVTLSPAVAALAMACSSVFVVTNSLRLGRLDLR